jgi:hypothetical protein
LQTFRSVTILDDVVKKVLEEQFQKGVLKTSNRKGVLEMVEECGKKVPTLMAPSMHEVNSWLSTRLSQAKKAESSDGQAKSVARNLSQEEEEEVTAGEATRGCRCHQE